MPERGVPPCPRSSWTELDWVEVLGLDRAGLSSPGWRRGALDADGDNDDDGNDDDDDDNDKDGEEEDNDMDPV